MRNEELRDCQAWKDEGLVLTTASNEAAKLYDSCLSQYVGWYDDPQMGGLETTLEELGNADPNFVLGKAFSIGLQLLGTSDTINLTPTLKTEYDSLLNLSDEQRGNKSLSEREALHVKAVSLWAQGSPSSAARVWEDILLEWPTDLHALRMAHDTYFYLGDSPQIMDSVARVLPEWEAKRPPMKSYLYGFYAFGLEENNHFERAEQYARKGLEENRFDGWSTHALAHVFEMGGRTSDGISFMEGTLSDWERCNYLACHNYWHVALYHVENENYEEAAQILEEQLLTRATTSKSMLDMVDCSSLLWRLNMLNPSSLRGRKTCQTASNICSLHCTKHVTTFNDAHTIMAFTTSGSSGNSLASELLETYSSQNGELVDHPTVGSKILQAFLDFRDEKYVNVVELLEPIRNVITPIGGSNAQRDVFNLMLIIAALKSTNPRDKKLAKVLINEREARKGRSTKLSERLGVLAHTA
ncbi:tetratricopeptide repeat protein 38 [Folsomia candida]|uniref:tetratricopeptide repeat protein 38 n=1 Tax=Folsomia candida TaxID=158441 RepID=UPI000B8FCF12|nr:tetratricopeptide repeat protein 38 [Folsomia candida]